MIDQRNFTKMIVDEMADFKKEMRGWTRDVEAKVNDAAPGSISMPGGDFSRMLGGIDQEDRWAVDHLASGGVKDAAQRVWLSKAVSLDFQIRKAMLAGDPHMAHEYQERLHKMYKAAGFDPGMAISKGAIGEGGAGGANIVPTPVEAVLHRVIVDFGIARQIAFQTVMTGPTHKVPTEANAIAVSIVAEAATIPDSVATTAFGSVNLVARKISGLGTCSNEVLETELIGLADYLFTAMAERIGRAEDAEAFDGQGTNFTGLSITSGVVSITVTGTAASGGVAPTYGDLVRLVYSAQQRSTRQGGFFALHPGAMREVVSLVDTTGQPIFHFSNVPNAIPERILGYPAFVSSAISVTNSLYTSSTNIYFGPVGKIILADLRGLSFATDPFGLFDKDQTRLRVTERVGIVTPAGAHFAYLKGAKY